MDSLWDSGIVLRHSLAEANELWRMCVTNKLTVKAAAKSLGLDLAQAQGTVRLLRKYGGVPSPERLALVAMRDPGLNDFDIAEMFRRTPRWASMVRVHAQELREAEPIPEFFEYLDEGLRPGDPTPEEIYRRAAELRTQRVHNYKDCDNPLLDVRRARPQPGLRVFAWNGRHASYVSIGTKNWPSR